VLDLPLYNYVRREGSICGLKVNSRSADMLQIFEILMEESLRIPDFEEELQYLAVRNLRDMVLQWSRCNEAWALECLEKARTLLEPLANLDYSNPYLIRERANAAERSRSVGLGKRLQRGLRTTFRSLRGALGIPRSKGV
jgi:hypothetical protein